MRKTAPRHRTQALSHSPMPDLSLILFDDQVSRRWEPFALTRPAGELLFGALRLRARAERVFGARCAAQLAPGHLAGFEELDAPPVRGYDDAPREGDRLFLAARAVPAWGAAAEWERREGPVEVGGEVVGWFAPAGAEAPPRDFFDDPATAAPYREGTRLPGRTLRHVWELMSRNCDQVAEDVRALFPDPPEPRLPAGVHRLGRQPLVLGSDVVLEPGVVVDTTDGPVWLDDGVVVRAFTRLCGPAYVGRETVLKGGMIEGVSVGPVCRIRGEISSSVALAYTNKQHDGHLGHAYLGAWVNLGAETTNSDLKNNYGEIRLWTPDGEAETGEIKLGSFLGDHVKTGIGLLLNTGTVVGAGSNLYGAEMPPRYVPPFSWGTGSELVEYRLDKFLEVAERVMERRGVALSPSMREQLGRAWARGRAGAG